ncbi:MAG TPA: class F sortase [Microlunatus sp.]|nr:class F sortase [Microlunatus sp.]
MGRPDALSRRAPIRPDPIRYVLIRLGLITAAASLVAGCTVAAEPVAGAGSAPSPTVGSSGTPTGRPTPGAAGEGTRAPSQVKRFVPVELILPGRERAKVVPVSTVDGELQVPRHVDHLGWWDGSSWLGDPFGATVIAGHVDSATEGLGFFAQLLEIRRDDRVQVLGSSGQRQTFEVTSVRTVAQNALAGDSKALSQTGDHRLVMITCTGAYRPGRGYESNLVVTAELVDQR